MGLWQIRETSPVTSQSQHEWEEEYEEFIYCTALHRELEPPLDDTEFFDGQDYVRFNAGANKLADDDAITFLEHLISRSDLTETARKRALDELKKMGVEPPQKPPGESEPTKGEEPAPSSGNARTKPDTEEQSVDLRPPKRTETTVSRVVRNTELAKRLKKEYDHRCQVCGQQRQRGKDEPYAEAHHIHPLGGDPPGVDHESNILVLCPNHHADFDYGTVEVNPNSLEITHAYDNQVDGQELVVNEAHEIGTDHLEYHKTNISIID